MNALMRWLGPASGRVPLPVDRREAESEAGELPQAWEVNILALRMSTVTRPQWSEPELRIIESRSA